MKPTALLFLLAGVAVLGGLFVALKPDAPAAPPPAPAAAAPATSRPAPAPAPVVAAPEPKTFDLVIGGGRITSGPAVIQVMQGDAVVLRVTADRADELHLHGYDLGVKLAPGVPGVIAFTADRSGRFEFELHKAHADLGAIEVQPK